MGLKPGRLWLILIIAGLMIAGCAASRPREGPCTVAVWELESIGVAGPLAEAGELLTARVVETLQASGRCTVIEREKLALALSELNLGASQLADEATRLRIGRLAGARCMIFGGFQAWSGIMRLDLRLVEVSTGTVLKAAGQTVSTAGLPQWLEAAEKAARELESALSKQ